jgi:Xaa-Pro dipeptidase
MFFNRLENVYKIMEQKGLSQTIVSDKNALFYLYGKWFNVGERMIALLLRIDETPILVLNDLFSFEDKDTKIVYFNDKESGPDKLLPYIIHHKALGIDKFFPSRFLISLMNLQAASAFKTCMAIDYARFVKDMDEQKLMIESSHINDLCIEDFKCSLRIGMSEKEMQEECYKIFKKHGIDRVSFTPIVAFKATAADPHHEPDDKTILEAGDMVLFDVGGVYKDYCSDMTRVFFTAEPTAFQREIYNLVRRANEEAIKHIKPGVALKDIDKIARDIIDSAGYGEYYNHRLGHFIGIEDHDFGDVSLSSDIIANPGMIFSIEPGIYIKDKIGVRIEDLVMVTKTGVKVLYEYPKDIQVLDLK